MKVTIQNQVIIMQLEMTVEELEALKMALRVCRTQHNLLEDEAAALDNLLNAIEHAQDQQ